MAKGPTGAQDLKGNNQGETGKVKTGWTEEVGKGWKQGKDLESGKG